MGECFSYDKNRGYILGDRLERIIKDFGAIPGDGQDTFGVTNSFSYSKETLIRSYLGYYFPHTYIEAFFLYYFDVFSNPNIVNSFKKKYIEKKDINCLSIGCGCGGDLIALVDSLMSILSVFAICNRNNRQTVNINVLAVDCNRDSLEILKDFVDKYYYQSVCKEHLYRDFRVNIIPLCMDIVPEEFDITLQKYVNETGIEGFDVISSFKMVNEIINHYDKKYPPERFTALYYSVISSYIDYLTEDGIFTLLDVTDQRKGKFLPKAFVEAVGHFLRDYKDFKVILPFCCAKFQEKCASKDCFIQNEIKIYNKSSKSTYFVFARKNLAEKINAENIDIFKRANSIQCPATKIPIENDAFLFAYTPGEYFTRLNNRV